MVSLALLRDYIQCDIYYVVGRGEIQERGRQCSDRESADVMVLAGTHCFSLGAENILLIPPPTVYKLSLYPQDSKASAHRFEAELPSILIL